MQKYFHAASGVYVDHGQPFSLGGISYPANWIERATPAEITALGLAPITVVGAPGDSRYYINSESLANGVLTITATLKPAAEIKASKWDDIKAERDRRTSTSGYKVGTDWYHSDVFSRTQQLGLVQLGANIPANTMWKTMAGAFVLMTPTLASQIFAAAVASDVAIFAAAEAHKAAMEASATPETYDFSAGWPKVYGEV